MSARLMEIENELVWRLRGIETFDHRVLQHAHDKIAAYYRFTCRDYGQPPLFNEGKSYEALLRDGWIDFYQREIDSLIEDDEVVRGILGSVAYENTEVGLAAEESLRGLLDANHVARTGISF